MAVLEWAPFRLAPGVSPDALREASAAMHRDFLSQQEGFLSRQLMRAADGTYVDAVWWTSIEAVERAMANVSQSAACAAYFKLMPADQAEGGAGVLLFQSVAEYWAGP